MQSGIPGWNTQYPIGKRRLERLLRRTVFGAQGHSGHETFPNVIRMIAARRLDLSPIVTACYGLEATVEAIAKSTERAGGKILVRPN
jgi:threonine dehydrogenase-like Zn-dependent dehydrogenase